MTTKLVSPTRGENYTLIDALKKGFYRSNLTSDSIRIIEVERNRDYGDADYLIEISGFGCSKSVWTESISFHFPVLFLKGHVKAGTDAFQFSLSSVFSSWDDETAKKREKFEWHFDPTTVAGEMGVGFQEFQLHLGEEMESFSPSDLSEEEVKLIKKLAERHILSELFISRFHSKCI